MNQSPDTISEADTKLFCKHASELQLVRGTCITDEYQGKNTSLQSIGQYKFYIDIKIYNFLI